MNLNFNWDGIKKLFKTGNVLVNVSIFILAILLAGLIALFSVIFSSGVGIHN